MCDCVRAGVCVCVLERQSVCVVWVYEINKMHVCVHVRVYLSNKLMFVCACVSVCVCVRAVVIGC